MKLWTLSTLCAASLLILSGCVSSPKPAEEVKVDNTLPIISLTQNGVIVDMKTIAFEWSSIKDPRVEGIYVYKQVLSNEKDSSLDYYHTIKNRFTTHYLDQNVDPDSKYNYAFKTFSKDSEGLESRLYSVNSLPVLSSVTWIHSITGMPRSSKIIWRPHSNNRVESYIIERKTLEDEKWNELATVKGRLNAEYIDENLNDNYVYMYRIRVLTYDDILSTPSQIVKVVTKPLPKSILNIRTTRNLPKKIKIDWNASTQKDFSLYYLYKSDSIDGSYELIATLHNNTFIDEIDEDGKSYFYRVSVVDKDGLESEHEKLTIQGMSLPKPSAPAMIEAKLVKSSIEIVWSKVDQRTVSYNVVKTQKKGWFDETSEEFKGIKSKQFIDKNIEADSTYSYVVYSVDTNGIKSQPSIKVKVETPESSEIESAPASEEKETVNVSPNSDETQEILSPVEDLNLNEI